MKTLSRKGLLSIIVMAGLSSASLPALADDHGKMHGMMGEHKKEMMDEFFDAVDATDTQKTQLRDLSKQYEAQTKPLMTTKMQKKHDLMQYISTPQSSQDEAMKREQEIIDIENQLGRMHIQHAFQKKAILTPEQQQKAATFMREQQEKWHKNMQDKMEDMHD